MNIPKRINPRWLAQQRIKLDCTARAIDGQPNPNYVSLRGEVEAAETELLRWNAFEEWVKRELGAVLNQYPLRFAGQYYEAGRVFFRKDMAGMALTVQEAWQEYEAKISI